MDYKICAVSGEPRFDSLPVIKVTHYPSAGCNDRMFAQCQLCLTPTHLLARLWAFETAPAEESELALYLSGPSGKLEMSVTAAGVHKLAVSRGRLEDLLGAYMIGGGDLQGDYWGGVLLLPVEILREELGLKELVPGTMFKGNVVKYHPSKGSAYLVEGVEPEDEQSFGLFEIVSY